MSSGNHNTTRINSAFEGGRGSQSAIPVLFQVIAPDNNTLLLPEYLYLHVNPQNMDFSYDKLIDRTQTKGGFVEQHFGEELSSISASGSTGAFVSVQDGVTTYNRRDTIAYRKIMQLKDVFKNNGSVYDDKGRVKFRGKIRIIFGGGIYDGFFTDFSISESADEPFNFQVSWSFTVEKERYELTY